MKWSRALQAVGAIVLFLAVGAFVIQAFPALVGVDYALVVQSGSMEPALETGSVVFVEEVPPETIEEGDIITYRDDGGNLITHRVVEIHQAQTSMRFSTKGDNNENSDPEPVYRDEFVGEVTFNIPLIGYVVAFGQTRLGWAVMVMVPTLLLIFSELWSLYRAMETEPPETRT